MGRQTETRRRSWWQWGATVLIWTAFYACGGTNDFTMSPRDAGGDGLAAAGGQGGIGASAGSGGLAASGGQGGIGATGGLGATGGGGGAKGGQGGGGTAGVAATGGQGGTDAGVDSGGGSGGVAATSGQGGVDSGQGGVDSGQGGVDSGGGTSGQGGNGGSGATGGQGSTDASAGSGGVDASAGSGGVDASAGSGGGAATGGQGSTDASAGGTAGASGAGGTSSYPGDVSGTRLKAKFWAGSDSAKHYSHAALYDSQLAIDCAYATASDGQLRCLPIVSPTAMQGVIYYSDASCTQPMSYVSNTPPVGCSPYLPKYVYSGQQTCPHGERRFRIYAVQSVIVNPTPHRLNNGSCGNANVNSPGMIPVALGAELPASSFVAGTRTHLP